MDVINAILGFITGENWLKIVALVWTIDQLLKIIAGFNPERDWVDNISDAFTRIITNFFPKKQ